MRTFLFCICQLWFCLLFAQGSFNRFYPFNESTIPSDIFVNKDSTYILLSQFNNSVTGTPGLLLTKFDKTGNTLSQKNHFSTSSDGYYIFLKNKMWASINDRYFIILAASGNTNNTTGILVAKIDAQTLDTIWTQRYSTPQFDLPTSHIFRLEANKYCLMGNKFNNNDPNYRQRPILYSLDTVGNISFKREIIGLKNYVPSALSYDSALKRIYVGGLNYSNPQTTQGFLACIDTSGAILWNQQIGNYPAYTAPYQIEKRNNYLIISGAKWTNLIGSNDRYRLTLLKVNCATGALIWQKMYGPEGVINFLQGFNIGQDERITACGSAQFYDQNLGLKSYGVMIQTSANGDSLWMRRYHANTGGFQQTFFDLQPALRNGFIMCGSPLFSQAPLTQNWVIKTDSLGIAPGLVNFTLTTLSNNPQSIVNVDLKIVPNPAIDKLHLNFSIPIDKSGTKIIIFNSLGEKMREEEIVWENGQAEVIINGLDAGIYFVELLIPEYKGTANKVIKKFVIGR